MRGVLRHVLFLGIAAGSVLAVAGPAAGAIQTFKTPSGNINCVWTSSPSYLRCDIRSGLEPRPPRPAACDLEWGYGLSMRKRSGVRVVCAGDSTIGAGAPVLRYGFQWSRGGFTCVSRRTGLTCTNAAGRGFRMSRGSWERF